MAQGSQEQRRIMMSYDIFQIIINNYEHYCNQDGSKSKEIYNINR